MTIPYFHIYFKIFMKPKIPYLPFPKDKTNQKLKKISQPAGFEPARGNPIGFRVQRLNHSATTAGWNAYCIFILLPNETFLSQTSLWHEVVLSSITLCGSRLKQFWPLRPQTQGVLQNAMKRYIASSIILVHLISVFRWWECVSLIFWP